MVTSDPIADLLTSIRNAITVNQNSVSVPYSSLKQTILIELKRTGFIEDVEVDSSGTFKRLNITIYSEDAAPKIHSISRISKPGRRIYSKADKMPKVKNGRGLVLVSTSKGVMTGNEAAAKRLGGELLCEVY